MYDQKKVLNPQSIYRIMIEQLHLNEGNGLIENETNVTIPGVNRLVEQARKIGIDSIYFVDGNPIIYFRRLSQESIDIFKDLQQIVWNQGRVTFLVVITPGKIRIFNGQALPASNKEELFSKNRLIFPAKENELSNELLDIDSEEKAKSIILKTLSIFSKQSIESEDIWKDEYLQRIIRRKDRVDRRLLLGLRNVRSTLISKGLSDDVINRLIIRSFFVMYLQDRHAIPDECIPPEINEFDYLNTLVNHDLTYKLFASLSEHFNGGLFDFSEEEKREVKEDHLVLIKNMLYGTDIVTGQIPLFRIFLFEHIPIEMISCLYEEFLQQNNQVKSGAFYTSPVLVRILLDEAIDWQHLPKDFKLLDPACGSGVFLVEAFNRIVDNWKISNPGKSIHAKELKSIIQNSLFGIDIDANATNVAIFSLYLALLDNLEPEYIRRRLKQFPSLVNKTLFVADFFDSAPCFTEIKFHLIIGNAPWESRLTKLAESYIKARKYTINDKQISLAYLWRARDFCLDIGEICLLVSSKAALFNQGAIEFRKEFFRSNKVNTVIDFSMLRRERSVMFAQAIGPAAAFFYKPIKPKLTDRITYVIPTLTPNVRWLGVPTIDSSEIKGLLLEQILSNDKVWKIIFWGSDRDINLIKHLDHITKLKDFIDKFKRVEPQEGYKLASPQSDFHPEAVNKRSISSKKRIRYLLTSEDTEPLGKDSFYSFKNPEIYQPPIVVIHQSPINGKIMAFLSEMEVIYPETYAGIPCSNEVVDYLKLLTLYLNSSLATYYYFLTSAKWGIERDDLQLVEHSNLPFLLPSREDLKKPESEFAKLLSLFDRIVELKTNNIIDYIHNETEISDEIDNLFFNLYGLTESERDLVKDTINFTIPFFMDPYNGVSTRIPESAMINEYIAVFKTAFEKISLHNGLYVNGAIFPSTSSIPLLGVKFSVTSEDSQVSESSEESSLFDLIGEINQKIYRTKASIGESVITRRHILLFKDSAIYFIKPKEKRFWTRSTARIDVDTAITSLLKEFEARKNAGMNS